MKKKKTLTRKSVVISLALICCLLWGSAFPCIKIGYKMLKISGSDTFSQILFAGMRFFLAGIFALLIGSVSSKRLLIPSRESLWKIVKLSIFQTILQYTFFYIGLARTTGVKSSIITSSNVFLSIIVAALIFHTEKLTIYKMIGCIVGFSGVILINLSGSGSFSGGLTFTGEGFVFLSALSYAFSAALTKRYSQSLNPIMLSGYQFILGGAFMMIVGLVFGGRIPEFNFSGGAMLIYLAFVSAAAFSLWGILLKYNPVSTVSVFGFMNPVFGVVLSVILLSEENMIAPLNIAAALLLVIAGIIIVNSRKSTSV